MAAEYLSSHFISDLRLCPNEAELEELRRLNERFRGHHIFWDFMAKCQIRFLAYAISHEARPHTIITQDLAEIRHELERQPFKA
jgi:hypothetical protein